MSATLQDQKLTDLKFAVGVIKEKTELDATGYWTDADKIRFRFGRPELMGGWQNNIDSSQAMLAQLAHMCSQKGKRQVIRFVEGTSTLNDFTPRFSYGVFKELGD